MKSLKRILELIRVNWQTMCGFEILFKLLSAMVFTPLFWWIFNRIMDFTGYEYLTIENILPFLIHPLTLAALLLLFVCMAFYTMIDISAVIFLLDQSCQKVSVNLIQTLWHAVRNACKVFRPENVWIAFVVLFLIPFLNIGVASGYVSSIAVPEFILDFIKGNWSLSILFLVAFTGLGALLLRWMYAFHYFTLEGCSFRKARQKSARLSKKHKLHDLAVLLGIQLLCYVLFLVLVLAGILFAVFLGSLFTKLQLLSIVSAAVVWVFLAVAMLVMSALVTPISYACISILFYEHKIECREEIFHEKAVAYRKNPKRRKWLHLSEWVLFLVSVACCSFYLYNIYNHNISIQIEYIRTMEVTAHRGASREYPENTMSAFVGAKKLGADWVELDVQQSRDGQIFVHHDTNFSRTAGVSRNTWEMDAKEIRQLDVGSFFDSRFAGEQIPLLSEVIDFAKDNEIRLNIEMKPTGHEQNFEQDVADLICQKQFEEQCVVTSQVYEVLETIKSYEPRIQTVYVMSLAYGNIETLSAADHFSIEASSITEKMVSKVHNAGKQLYGWTVNTEESIERMIELNVDNIITDDVELAKECVYLSKTSDVVTELVKWLAD